LTPAAIFQGLCEDQQLFMTFPGKKISTSEFKVFPEAYNPSKTLGDLTEKDYF